jgi:hypothetical protein
MRLLKEIIKFWNSNFDKGVTIFQITLMVTMILGAVLGDKTLILFSMFSCLCGYLEPSEDRFSLLCNQTKREVRGR